MITSFSGAKPEAMTAIRAWFFEVVRHTRRTLWYVSFLGAFALLNSADLLNAWELGDRGVSTFSAGLPSAFLFREGRPMRKDRRCSFLPASCSMVELLIPAIAVSACSLEEATARVVTESSSFASSISAISLSSSRREVSISDYAS